MTSRIEENLMNVHRKTRVMKQESKEKRKTFVEKYIGLKRVHPL